MIYLTLCLLAAAAVLWLGRRQPAVARPVAALLVVIGVLVLMATRPRPAASLDEHSEHDEHDEQSETVHLEAEMAEALGLVVEPVLPGELASTLSVTGRLIAVEANEAHLGPTVAGRVAAVEVKVGDRVAAGAPVAWLDSVDVAQAAAAARESAARLTAAGRALAAKRELAANGAYSIGPLESARREAAEARLERAGIAATEERARNELAAAQSELERTEALAAAGEYTTAASEASRRALADAERDLTDAEQALAAAETEQAAAEAELANLRTRLEGAQAVLARTERLAATGELDRAPLEQADNAVAAARARREQAEAAAQQARRLVERGEAAYRSELISLNELEQRRTEQRDAEAALTEAESALVNAEAALARQQAIHDTRLVSGRAVQEAANAAAEAERAVAGAEATLGRFERNVEVARRGLPPATARVAAARASHEREQATAEAGTHAARAIDAARLRVDQAARSLTGAEREQAESARKVAAAESALAREAQLAQGQVRAREQLLEAERDVAAARIARDAAAEVVAILGGARAERRDGRLLVPIRSPRGGLVTEVHAAAGMAVGPEADLVTVVSLSELYVEADVTEQELPRVAEGQLVQVTVAAFPAETFTGSVVAVAGRLDPETRAAHVRALLRNPDGRLRPEMFAQVEFFTARRDGVLSVPEEAVQELDGVPHLFIQTGAEEYTARAVEVGPPQAGQVELLAGLEPGERVVVGGAYLLRSQLLKGELGEGHAH